MREKPIITLSTSKLDYQEWFSGRAADAMCALTLLSELIHKPKSPRFSFSSRKDRQEYRDDLIFLAIHDMYILYLKCQGQDGECHEDYTVTLENVRRIYTEGNEAWEAIRKELSQ